MVSKNSKCSRFIGPLIRMSSKYITTPGIPCRILPITLKIPKAAKILNDSRVYGTVGIIFEVQFL